jgi:hypothetical protein
MEYSHLGRPVLGPGHSHGRILAVGARGRASGSYIRARCRANPTSGERVLRRVNPGSRSSRSGLGGVPFSARAEGGSGGWEQLEAAARSD